MKRFARFAMAALLRCASLFAQAAAAQTATSAQFIASRQGEVERMSEALFSTHLDDGTWARREVASCPELRHHAFARFDAVENGGETVRFLAFYDLDRAPASSPGKPWQGGIVLLRLHVHGKKTPGTVPSEASMITAFNRVLRGEEEAATTRRRLPMSADGIAHCFARVSGEEPASGEPDGASDDSEKAPYPVGRVMVPLVSHGGFLRMQYVSFDRSGLIAEAEVVTLRADTP